MSQKLGRWNSKKAYQVTGGGLISSLPPTAPPSDYPDEGARPVASTSALPASGAGAALAPAGAKKRKAAEGKGAGRAKKMVSLVPTLPWPEHFKELEKTFKALSTVYTFVSSRKSMVITFDTLAGAVQNLLKRPLEIHDIAQMKSLLPHLLTFAYVDPELTRIHSDNNANLSRRVEKRKEVDEAYVVAGGLGAGPVKPKGVVLSFEFNDAELKASNGVGKLMTRKFKWKSKKKDDEPQVELPKSKETVAKFSTKSMADLIAKRNLKFVEAVNELLLACAAHEPVEDPVGLLLAATQDHLPAMPQPEDGEGRNKGLKEKRGDLDFYVRNPDQRMSVEQMIKEVKVEDWYVDQIVDGGHRQVPPRKAVVGELEHPLSQALWDALYATKKISSLYSHQAEALNAIDGGKSVIVSTSTASGKSLIYQVPIIKALENDPPATALFIFPTKALAQDQKRSLSELLSNYEAEALRSVKVATFDGDTPKEDRDYIRENASVIFTNPDTLHITLLPREEQWRRFFRNLRFVVVDEIHSYAGLFGTHVAFIARRLRRICAAIGNRHVQFISCSATTANPGEHMEALFGIEDVEVIGVDGSPSGQKEFLVWNPPFQDERDLQAGRVSTVTEASRLFRFLMDRGARVIVFCKVRRYCEILMKQVRTDLLLEGRTDMAEKVMSYRSGYTPLERRKIEQEMFSGRLLGVIATTALELGIDLGTLDAVISVGFYTLAGLRQQWGRAGRRQKDSLAILISDPFPLGQHYARNPDRIYDSPFDSIHLDLENPIVLEGHVQVAADEMPINPVEDAVYFGSLLPQICEQKLVGDVEGWYHTHPRLKPYPARTVAIRNTEDETYTVVDISHGRNKIIEEIEHSRAIFTLYEGAVFHQQGFTFLVTEVSHERRLAKVRESVLDYSTRQRDYTNVDALEALAIREVAGSDCVASFGTVKIESVVFGYFKVNKKNFILDTVDLFTPPYSKTSHGLWIDVPKRALDILIRKNIEVSASIHAAEHALMSLTPIVAMSAEGDLKTECKQPEKELASQPSSRKRPARLILYDSAGMSGGICAKAFDHISMLLQEAADTIARCKCTDGCPACVASAVCSGANTIVSKLGALVVLDSILNRPIDIDSIPLQEPAQGFVPGGSIDLRGVRRGRTSAQGIRGVMEEDELTEEQEAARELELAELMG